MKWHSTTMFVDLETAEVLTKQQVKDHYTIVNTNKITKVYGATPRTPATGQVIYVRECRPTKQTKIIFTANDKRKNWQQPHFRKRQ